MADRLSDLPRRIVTRRGSFVSDSAVEHHSPLVRLFAAGDRSIFRDGIDAFIAYYIRPLEGGESVNFGRRRRDVRESVRRETELQQRQTLDDHEDGK